MRHVVQYHQDLNLWSVADSQRGMLTVGFHQSLTEARNSAYEAEERWYNKGASGDVKPFQAGERFRPSMIGASA